MPSKKSPEEERQTIVSQPHKRPYGATVRVHTQTAGAFGQVEDTEIEFATGAFAKLAPARMAPWEGGRKYTMKLEGFPTAAAAEAAGRRLVQAVLWMAISTDAPVRLDYKSYDPFTVFERMRSEGPRVEAFGETYFQPAMVFDELQEAYESFSDPDPKLLLSMEIFAGARLEASDRARFLAVVSALEPLAGDQSLGMNVETFVGLCLTQLKEVNDIAPEVRASLEGRVRQLKSASVRQAVKKVVREAFPDEPEAANAIDDAYSLRSEIIHSGRPADLDVDLEHETKRVSHIIRRMYASRLGRALLKPATV